MYFFIKRTAIFKEHLYGCFSELKVWSKILESSSNLSITLAYNETIRENVPDEANFITSSLVWITLQFSLDRTFHKETECPTKLLLDILSDTAKKNYFGTWKYSIVLKEHDLIQHVKKPTRSGTKLIAYMS